MTRYAAMMVAILGALLCGACSSGGGNNNGPILCNTQADCPSGWICLDGQCQEPATPDGDTTTDGDEVELDEADEASELVPCDFICCTDAECVPPTWTSDQPRWYCDDPGTAQSTCKQEAAPCAFECCDTADCVDNFAGNPNKCSYFRCQSPGTADAACIQDFDCDDSAQYCTGLEITPWAYYICRVDNQGCKYFEDATCDQIKDCEENMDGTISCLSSRRCHVDNDCTYPNKCLNDPAYPNGEFGRCDVPTVGAGQKCAENCVTDQATSQINCVMVAYCDSTQNLTCLVDTSSGQEPYEGTCGTQK